MVRITGDTNDLISDLNEKLEENCSDLQLTLTVFPNGVDVKLCLLNNDECVSYLTITDYNGTFNILSRTNDAYQGRGYNKFLTAVSIYLADTLTECEELYSSTSVEARIHILSQYEHRLEDEEDEEEIPEKLFNFFIPIDENKNQAENIITEWIQNKCVKNKANDEGRGNKTRRNKQRRKSKTRKSKTRKSKTRKSKRRKTKRLYKYALS